jgi:hypothetical protein
MPRNRTQAVVVAVEELGHDQFRVLATPLLELPGCRNRVLPGRSNVFRLACCRMAEDAPTRFQQVAEPLNGEDLSRMISGRSCSLARTNSRGLASPKEPERLRLSLSY